MKNGWFLWLDSSSSTHRWSKFLGVSIFIQQTIRRKNYEWYLRVHLTWKAQTIICFYDLSALETTYWMESILISISGILIIFWLFESYVHKMSSKRKKPLIFEITNTSKIEISHSFTDLAGEWDHTENLKVVLNFWDITFIWRLTIGNNIGKILFSVCKAVVEILKTLKMILLCVKLW